MKIKLILSINNCTNKLLVHDSALSFTADIILPI